MRDLNPNKIAFISAVNNETLYEQCVEHIEALDKPENMEIEIIRIRNAKSLTSAYNQAQGLSDAKYKVYLHQDLLIIDKEFITKVIGSFVMYSNVGIMGVVGCTNLPKTAIWWDGQIVGQFIDNHTGVLQEYRYTTSPWLRFAEALDGCILCTQYDIPWREDIFDGWHFYDISQCMEYIRHGYKVAIIPITDPMTIHLCGICDMAKYDYYRQRFIETYF